jgi:hypothetical protein
MDNNETALDRFIGIIGETDDRLEELKTFFDEHMKYSPEDINWGHVGTATHFLERLTELTDIVYKRGECRG